MKNHTAIKECLLNIIQNSSSHWSLFEKSKQSKKYFYQMQESIKELLNRIALDRLELENQLFKKWWYFVNNKMPYISSSEEAKLKLIYPSI